MLSALRSWSLRTQDQIDPSMPAKIGLRCIPRLTGWRGGDSVILVDLEHRASLQAVAPGRPRKRKRDRGDIGRNVNSENEREGDI
ncbi:hypothetical protein ASPCAL08056 [Aspergillus calidoustus]|uniref:Uncharacterized protein n=1 Tax=Aspergillus calidoustus TaxID=454130 RepID=A0A0U5GR78_ASPCI|nr:hypothetical protein ASPCAL08056 [Aspergillus calidoustus]